MIDEKELIKRLEELTDEYRDKLANAKNKEHKNFLNGAIGTLIDATNMVRRQPKIDWISVDERLPEKETNVLCFIPRADGNVQHGIYVGQIRKVKANDGSGNIWGIPTKECDWALKGWSYFEHPTIIAWWPLPETWKGDDEK